MDSLSSVSKRLILLHIFTVVAIQLKLIRSVSSLNTTNAYLHHKCIASQGKYQHGSEFEKNLDEIISSTGSSNFGSGFSQMTKGEGSPNAVTFMYQCRGDSYGRKCLSCYTTAERALRRRCPRNKGAIIWYDQCLVKISSITTNGQIDYANNICMSNAKNVSGNPQLFRQKMADFMYKLSLKATDKDNIDGYKLAVLYAAGEDMYESKKMYGMVQCTKDLWFSSCSACLEYIVLRDADCCEGKQGGKVFGTSCTFRYEFYPFLKISV